MRGEPLRRRATGAAAELEDVGAGRDAAEQVVDARVALGVVDLRLPLGEPVGDLVPAALDDRLRDQAGRLLELLPAYANM